MSLSLEVSSGSPARPGRVLVPAGPGGPEQRAHRLGIHDQVSLAHHPQHGQEMIVDPVRRDQGAGPGRQRAGEFRGIERLGVHQNRRDAKVGDQVPVARLRVHQHRDQRAAVPSGPVRAGGRPRSPHQHEGLAAGQQRGHDPVEGRTGLATDHRQDARLALSPGPARDRRGLPVQHAERGGPGHGVRAAAHLQLGVDPALEVLHPLRADAQQRRDLRDDVPGAGKHHDLQFPVGQALVAGTAPALPGVPGPLAAHLGEHRGQPVRLGDQRGHARPAGRGEVFLARFPVDDDDVQLRETPHQVADPASHLAEPAPRVENHHVGAAQLAKIEDVICLGDPADHGHVRADRETGRESVTEKPLRGLHCDADGDACGEHRHR
jgi:hypothetical protein